MTVWVKPPPELKKRVLSPKQKRQPNFSLGRRGEAKAVEFLQEHNYKILDINIRNGNSEIDIVALDRKYDEVAFVEVKARRSDFYGDPSLAVNQKKIESMEKVARVYLKTKKLLKDYRFDIITITPKKIRHFKNISWL